MTWFTFALITMLAWGGADLFYKKGAEGGQYSHLRTSIAVGIVMGAHAVYTLIFGSVSLFGETPYNFANLLVYLPVSIMYILSMTVGYFGLKYLELSVSSPVQNTSGAVVCLLSAIFLKQTFDFPVIGAVAVITCAMVLLGIIEKAELDGSGDKKYRIGFAAFFIPIAYCVIDALGTFLDGFYLDDISSTPLLSVTEDTIEDVANTSYELTFLIAAIVLSIFVFVIKKQKIVENMKPSRFIAAALETAGQYTYVYAMADEAAVAAIMVSAYAVVSMILSRIFLKEKLNAKQYACIIAVIIGIAVLGFYDI